MEDLSARVLGLLEPLYDAALGRTEWSGFLAELMSVLESDAAALVTLDRAGNPLTMMGEGMLNGPMMDAYPDYVAIDPWPDAYAAAGLAPGKSVCSHELLDPAAFEKTAYYYDYWRHYGDLFYTCGVLLSVEDGIAANFAVPRCRSRGPYTPSDKRILDLVSPHVCKALRLRGRLASGDRATRGFEEAIEAIGGASLVLDANGRILFANRAAIEELARGRCLTTHYGRLVASSLKGNTELQSAIRATAATVAGTGLACPAPVALRMSDTSTASVTCFALSMPHVESTGMSSTARLLVVIDDVQRVPQGLARVLRLMFGLTPTEALLAEGLAGGDALDDVAQRLSMTKGTARVHLRHVFLKTNTQRQAQLVALVHRAVPVRLLQR